VKKVLGSSSDDAFAATNITGGTLEETFPLNYHDTEKLLNDIVKLYKKTNSHDIEITVGSDEYSKTFKAHSNILKIRSSYFNTALLDDSIQRSNDGIILFRRKDISPETFEIILE